MVNNAASSSRDDAAVADLATEVWEAVIRANLTAPFWLCRSAIGEMTNAGHGSIINISTRQAERASKNFTAYVASKAGLNGLTRAIAVDYADRNIRCNTISPGFILNDSRDADMDATRSARYEAMHLTRLGVADDVASAAVYFACSESEFVTGTNLQLDGGSSIARGLTLG